MFNILLLLHFWTQVSLVEYTVCNVVIQIYNVYWLYHDIINELISVTEQLLSPHSVGRVVCGIVQQCNERIDCTRDVACSSLMALLNHQWVVTITITSYTLSLPLSLPPSLPPSLPLSLFLSQTKSTTYSSSSATTGHIHNVSNSQQHILVCTIL